MPDKKTFNFDDAIAELEQLVDQLDQCTKQSQQALLTEQLESTVDHDAAQQTDNQTSKPE